MESTCRVCNEHRSKYKCKLCQIRYCSITCYKTHWQKHDEFEEKSVSNMSVGAVRPVPDSKQARRAEHEAQDRLEKLANAPELIYLLQKHPSLRDQLRELYALTAEPSEEDKMLMSQPSFGQAYQQRGRGKSGPWTQQKADDSALRIIARAQREPLREGENGLREFITLVDMTCHD